MLAIAIGVIIFIPDISYRFKEFVQVISDSSARGSISLRMNIFKCSYSAIVENPIFGYGIGDVKEVLHECYFTFPDVFKNGKYFNSHNQYMSVWLSSGIFGLISLLVMLSYNFIKAIKAKDFIFGAILILFSSIMFIENILERQDGVLLFSLFLNLFAFKTLRENNMKMK